jgi:long-chain acyl-CoA synthetase
MNLEFDLGLDSLSRAEVFASLEQAFNIEFDSEKAANALNVGEVIKLTQDLTGSQNAEIIEQDFNWGKIVREAEDESPEVRGIIKNRPIFSPIAYLFFKTCGLLSRIFFRMEMTGKEEIAKLKRPYIVCPNHQSYLDPFIVTSAYPYEVIKNTFALGHSDFFQGRLMQLIARMMNTVPINADTQLLRAIRASATGLKHGKVLNIFPEGERAFDGELHEFKKGAAILASELDLPIVPVALDGLHKVWGRSSGKITFAKVKVHFGKPFYPKEIITPDIDDETKYRVVTEHLKRTIQTMIEELRN